MNRRSLITAALVALSVAAAALPAQTRDVVVIDARTGLPLETKETAKAAQRAPTAGENLEVALFSGPVQATQNQDIAGSLVLQIRNSGTTTVPYGPYTIVLSDDPIIEATDRTLLNQTVMDTIAPGGVFAVDFTGVSAVVPFNQTTGPQYLGVILDRNNNFEETDETDNTAYQSITILADPTVRTVFTEDFQDGEAGWTSLDLLATGLTWWNRTSYFDGVSTRGVMWCGGDDPNWVTGPGYGNNWNEKLRKSFTLPAGNPSIDYIVQYDTEPSYDFLRVEVSNDGGLSYTTLDIYDGNSGGFVARSTDLTAYAGQTVVIQFHFTSDGGWSDEDGAYPTDGAARIDSVLVSGYSGDGFETGNDGWEPVVAAGTASQLYRLEESPYCHSSVPCDEYQQNAGDRAGEPVINCNAWVAYDPVTLEFPSTPPGESGIRIAIESPPFSIPTDATVFRLEFDLYARLDIYEGVFFTWYVSAPAGSDWQNGGSIYYNVGGWTPMSFDITNLIPPGTSDMQVRLVGVEIPSYSTLPTQSEGPYFDNVRIRVAGGSSGGIDDSLFPRACSYQPGDSDGDGVFDVDDGEPTISAVPFDRNGDGVPDDPRGARHIEYWGDTEFPIPYVINDVGAPDVTDGSDFTEIQSALNEWATYAGVEVAFDYQGTTSQADADALDGINLITCSDPDFDFPSGVIAVGISTSFTRTTDFMGTTYRPGQIADIDMIFNPHKKFKTPTDGPPDGTDLRAVATHEGGHLLGISHTAVQTSTMFYVLPPAAAAATLELDDQLAILKAYPDSVTAAFANRIEGSVTDGYTSMPISGAVVFAINAASGDTSSCDFTLTDGTFQFVGLPDGDYYVAVYPLNGTSPIGYLAPENVNDMVFGTVFSAFSPEYWDGAESTTDDPNAKTAISVSGGSRVSGVAVVTNIDASPPTVVTVSPAVDATGVVIDAAVLISFSEPIDGETLQGNFSVTDSAGTFMSGNAALLDDDTTLAFIPASAYAFSTTYEVKIDTGLTDVFGNGLSAPFVWHFETEERPAVSITTLAPSKGGAGSTVVVSGLGLGDSLEANQVLFDGQAIAPSSGASNQVVFEVPADATPGGKSVEVVNLTTATTSNTLTFTVLEDEEVPRGFDIGSVALGALPRKIAVVPDGSRAFIATDAGLSIVSIDPGEPDFLAHTAIPLDGGLNGLDVTPDGQYVFAVSTVGQKVYRVNADLANGPLEVVNETSVAFPPRGVVVDPSGRRAYISTGAGRIRVWDTREASATYDREIGAINSPFASLGGNMAVDPAGNYLFALGGGGELAVFDVDSDVYVKEVDAGAYPRDVIVDPAGRRAYLADDNGYVTVVRLDTHQKVIDVQTGGQLRGVAVTPGGSYLYAVNRALNTLDVIDLRESSARFRTVSERLPQTTNPLGMAVTPDGDYVLSICESDRTLHVTAVGFGPTIASLAPQAAPIGAKIVIAGTGFVANNVDAVSFNGIDAAPTRVDETSLTVTVPAGAGTGSVRVKGSTAGGLPAVSNDLYFELLGPTGPGTLSPAAKIGPAASTPLAAAFDVSVDGRRAVVGDELGHVHVVDIDEDGASFHRFALDAVASSGAVSGVAISPDRTRVYVVSTSDTAIAVVDIDDESAAPGGIVGTVALPAPGAGRLAVSPDGRRLLVSDAGSGAVYIADTEPGSVSENQIVATAAASAGDVAVHPGGEYAYLADTADNPAVVRVLDLRDATLGDLVGSVALPDGTPDEVPVALSFSPDGERCFALTSQLSGAPNRTIVTLTTTNPAAPAVAGSQAIPTSGAPAPDRLRVSPRGDRAVVNVGTDGFYYLDVTSAPSIVTVNQLSDPVLHSSPIAFDYSADGSRLYAASTANDSVFVFDFSGIARTLSKTSGDNQTGVSGQTLSQPVRVRATATAGGEPARGVAVTFTITAGSGWFVTDNPLDTLMALVVATDAQGYASARWRVGEPVGSNTQQIQASALGLAGSPVTFTASSLVDPEALPLTLTAVKPAHQLTGVKVTTGIQARFSRPVKRSSVTSATFYLQNTVTATKVPAFIGFADGDRQASITPAATLSYGTTYAIFIGTTITDSGGGALQNPAITTFTTSPPPSVALKAVSPPSATPSVDVVISGEGFSTAPADNTVTFNGTAASVVESDVDFLRVKVPVLATSGEILVTTPSNTSNPLPFTVLDVQASPVDDVLATIGTGSSTRSVSLTPDGTRAYAVSPDANVVVVVNLNQLRTIAAVPVGETPYALTINPSGKYAYVANLISGTVSVIDIDPNSPTANEVVETLVVGTAPTDIAMGPGGDRVVVANAGSQDLSLIDSGEGSETFNQVLATIGVGASSRTVSISPDGGRWYIGTETGYIVMDGLNHAVLATIGVGASTRSTTITPDGGLLVLLTTLGEVFVFDVADGSPTENQVLATIGKGTSTRSVGISPDGGLLYLIQDEVDEIIVVSTDIFRGVSAMDPDASADPLTLTVVDTLQAGENPSFVAFDPSGSGQVLVTNEGDASITVFDSNPVVLDAEVVVSAGELGPGVSASIELSPSFSPQNVDLGGVTLSGSGSVPALPGHTNVFDADGDGVDELHLYFDRVLFQQVIPQGDAVPVTVSGSVGSIPFSGTDTLSTHPPVVTVPASDAKLSADSHTIVEWDTPLGALSDTADVFWTHDEGATWAPIATAIPDTGGVQWDVPHVHYDSCRVMVRIYRSGEVVGMGMSEGVFSINGSVATALHSAAATVERGAAVLRWKTNEESSTSGFRVYRSDREDGRFDAIGEDLIAARGAGSSYEFRDDTIVPNRLYYYRLVEVEEGGSIVVLWSGSAMLKLVFALEQNYPNPFNPVTTITFSIPEPAQVRLAVYDVAGRLVRTLVDEKRRANYYRIQWDGTDNHGQRVASGVYFYKIVAGTRSLTRKMLLLK